MTPTEMAMLRQQMQGMGGQIGQGGFDQLRQNLQAARPSMPQMPTPQHEQPPMMAGPQGQGGGMHNWLSRASLGQDGNWMPGAQGFPSGGMGDKLGGLRAAGK